MKNVYIAGIENPQALEVEKWLTERGYQVKTGNIAQGVEQAEAAVKALCEEWSQLDLLVICAGKECMQDGAIGTGHDYEALLQTIDCNVNGAQTYIEGLLPLLRKGTGKRIGFLTDRKSSINYSMETAGFGLQLSRSALNMMGKLYFNQLRPEGFTFRCYCQGENTALRGMCAGRYLTENLCYDAEEPYIHSEENRFVMRDSELREVPW